MSLRLILWTLFLGYVGFLLASTKSASSVGIDIVGAFLGAMIGFGLARCHVREESTPQTRREYAWGTRMI